MTHADGLEIFEHLDRNDPELAQLIAVAAGLTQAALAKRVRTTQSVIARLEDANYEGHSLTMLNRVARALGQRLEIRMLPATEATVAT